MESNEAMQAASSFCQRRASCAVRLDGRVNETWRVHCRDAWREDVLVVQRISDTGKAVRLVSNTAAVSGHLASSLSHELGAYRMQRPLVSLADGVPYIRDRDGRVWRAFSEIGSAAAPDRSAAEGYGRAIGCFHRAMLSFVPAGFNPVHPECLDLPSCLRMASAAREGASQEDAAILNGVLSRASAAVRMHMAISSQQNAGWVLGCCGPRSFSLDSVTGDVDGFRYFDCVSRGLPSLDLGDLLWRLCEGTSAEPSLWAQAVAGLASLGERIIMPVESAAVACLCQAARFACDAATGCRRWNDRDYCVSSCSRCLALFSDIVSRLSELSSALSKNS